MQDVEIVTIEAIQTVGLPHAGAYMTIGRGFDKLDSSINAALAADGADLGLGRLVGTGYSACGRVAFGGLGGGVGTSTSPYVTLLPVAPERSDV